MADGTQLLDGQIVEDGGVLAVNVGGRVLPASTLTFLTGYPTTVGDPVMVLVCDGRGVVLGRKQPGAASVVPTPNPSAPLPPAPPRRRQTGTDTINAVESGSFQPGFGWDYAGDRVMQWQNGSNRENRGAWFYGWRPEQFRGRTIRTAQLRLGPRLRVGAYDVPLTLHIYRHTNRTRPAGDVTRVGSPTDVTIPANSTDRDRWVDIPVADVQAIVDNGGGLAILGSPHGGVEGIETFPTSGQLRFNWER